MSSLPLIKPETVSDLFDALGDDSDVGKPGAILERWEKMMIDDNPVMGPVLEAICLKHPAIKPELTRAVVLVYQLLSAQSASDDLTRPQGK